MLIGSKEVLRLIKEKKLIEGLSKRELENPEGCKFDLRIKSVSKPVGEGFVGVNDRKTPKFELMASFDAGMGDEQESFTIKPGEYFNTESLEFLNLPEDMFGVIKPRSTLFRSGIIMRAGVIDPGYSGEVHPALFNASQNDFTIQMGARYMSVFFMRIEGDLVRSYEGQWQGGREFVEELEVQI